jgi:hypothetical protein
MKSVCGALRVKTLTLIGGGSHICPDLGYLEGTLRDVIHEAIALRGFWQYGSGGTIRKVPALVAPGRTERLMARRKRLLTKLELIERELGIYNGRSRT